MRARMCVRVHACILFVVICMFCVVMYVLVCTLGLAEFRTPSYSIP